MSKLIAFVMFIGLLPADIFAREFVTECIRPSGFKYYLPSLLQGEQSAGWKADKITGGVVVLFDETQDKPALLTKDATGKVTKISATYEDRILWLPSVTTLIKPVIVIYNDTTEIYMFSLDINNNGTLLVMTARGNPMMPSAGIMKYTCKGDQD